MTQYKVHPCSIDSSELPTDCAWFEKEPLLAVATSSGSVHIYRDEVGKQDYLNKKGEKQDATIKRDCEATSLSWSPTQQLLAIGWEDGRLTLWNETSKTITEPQVPHTKAVQLLQWDPWGLRLLSGDRNGLLVLWRVDNKDVTSKSSLNTLKRGSDKGKKASKEVTAQGVTAHVIAQHQKDGAAHRTALWSGSASDAAVTVGGPRGILWRVTETNARSVLTLGEFAALRDLWEGPNGSVALTLTGHVIECRVTSEGKWEAERRLRLFPAEPEDNFPATRSENLIIVGDRSVRVWELGEGPNYTLALPTAAERVTALAYHPRRMELAVATTGAVGMVRWMSHRPQLRSPADWQWMGSVEVAETVTHLSWAPVGPWLAVRSANTQGIVLTAERLPLVSGDLMAHWEDSSQIVVERFRSESFVLQPSLPVKGIQLLGDFLTVWGGKKVEVYEIKDAQNFHHVTGFHSAALWATTHGDTHSVVLGFVGRIEIASFQGTIKQSLQLGEGIPQFQATAHWLVAFSQTSGDHLHPGGTKSPKVRQWLQVWDLQRREVRPAGERFWEGPPPVSVAVNCRGSHVAFIARQRVGSTGELPETGVRLWDVERNVIEWLELSTVPRRLVWDPREPRLLAIGDEANVSTFFVSGECDAPVPQDQWPLPPDCSAFLGLKAPWLFFASESLSLVSHVMRDFVGMEQVDDTTCTALLNFSFHLSVGNMDEAYRAVKEIENETVWENMARMCVKTARIDVAGVCLAQLQRVRGCRALRESSAESPQVVVATLAVEMGDYAEAARLYEAAERWDLLKALREARNEWPVALQVARTHDRIHLRTAHFHYARHLEAIGDVTGAMEQYQKAATHQWDVPRMLFEAERFEELEQFVDASEDSRLLEWWARYAESKRAFDKALEYYRKAGNFLSLVRIHCFLGDIQEATQIALESDDIAASYHLARHYENEDNVTFVLLD